MTESEKPAVVLGDVMTHDRSGIKFVVYEITKRIPFSGKTAVELRVVPLEQFQKELRG